MNNLLILTKVLFKNGGNPFESGFENKKKKGMIIFVLLCFAPLIIQNTIQLMVSYDMFAKMNIGGQIMAGIFSSGSLAMIMFGIFYAISIYYFSGDVEILLSLPLRPYQILGAKFAIVLFYEYFIETLFILPVFIAYGFKIGNIVYFIYSIIIFLFLPVIPVVICSLISMFIMTFTKFIRDKDRFKTIAGIFSIILALGLNLIIIKFSDIGSKNQIEQTIQNNIPAINATINIFPSVKLAANALFYSDSLKSIANLILFIVISIGAVMLILLFAEALYLKGVIDISTNSSKGKKLTNKKMDKIYFQRSKLTAYILKELKLLFRTPAYFLNCILGGVIFPAFMLLIFMLGDTGLSTFIKSTDTGIFLIISTAFIIFLSSFNMITSTAISREGDNLYVCRYIPISYEKQIMAKVLSGVIISYISMVIMILISAFIFKIKHLMIIFILIVSAVGIFSLSFIGIIIDLNFPKLDWDNETKAVKQNFNVGIDMMITILILVVLGFVVVKLEMNVLTTFIFLILGYGVLGIILYKISMTAGVRLLSGENK